MKNSHSCRWRLSEDQQRADEFTVCGVLVGKWVDRPKAWTL